MTGNSIEKCPFEKMIFDDFFLISLSRSPALSVQSVCLSISSMLSSCREKKRPADNAIYVKTCNKNPKKTKWWYHGASNILPLLQSCPSWLVFSFQTTPFNRVWQMCDFSCNLLSWTRIRPNKLGFCFFSNSGPPTISINKDDDKRCRRDFFELINFKIIL